MRSYDFASHYNSLACGMDCQQTAPALFYYKRTDQTANLHIDTLQHKTFVILLIK